MRILIAYYSRTNFTKKLAEELATSLSADIEEVVDLKDRRGPLGFVMAGKDAVQNNLTEIKPITKKVADYDLIIVATPVWVGTMATAIRTFLIKEKDNFKKVACLATQGGKDLQKVFTEIEKVIEQKLIANDFFVTKEIAQEKYRDKLASFIEKIKQLQ